MKDEDIILPVKYVKKLQQKNKELQKDIDKLTSEATEWEDRYYRLQDKWDVSIIELGNKNKELHERIDKAIKYINDRMIVEQSFCLDMKQCYELTAILKDSDVDE